MSNDIYNRAVADSKSGASIDNLLPWAIRHVGGSNAQKWISYGVAAWAGYKLIKEHAGTIRQKLWSRKRLTTHIKENDILFEPLIRWMAAASAERKDVQDFDLATWIGEINVDRIPGTQTSGGGGAPLAVAHGDESYERGGLRHVKSKDKRRLNFLFKPTGSSVLHWQGIAIVATLTPQGVGKDNLDAGSFVYKKEASLALTFGTKNKDLIQKFFGEVLEKYAIATQESPAMIYVWGGWRWQAIRPCPVGRKVVLPEKEYERLHEELKDFLEGRELYESRNIPWRFGMCMEGIPGSGKTTTIAALCGEFKLNVYILFMNNLTNDEVLRCFSEIPQHGVVLLEDIDCVFKGRKHREEGTKEKSTFDALLNSIDGIATPDGRITFMTTNHIEDLDDALIRPGRMDHVIKFTYATPDQITRLARNFHISKEEAEELGRTWTTEHPGISMAEVQKRLRVLCKQRQTK